MRPLKTIAMRIGRTAQAGLQATTSAAKRIGLSLGSFLIATAAGAIYAATIELRDALVVICAAFALLFLLDLFMLRRGPSRGK